MDKPIYATCPNCGEDSLMADMEMSGGYIAG